MAAPRIFISSTCYDLADVRDNLEEFIHGFGFDTALSEKGDVFYHPDLHTHESCIKEVSNCQMLVIIIGGRFGGSYNSDTNKSIVNAEYSAAKTLNIPIFAFVKNDVNEDHRLYSKNKRNASIIHFPSIEKQEHALRIFEFIDEVRKSQTGNGYFSFNYTSEIKEHLKKQWAGMFFDFLEKRSHEIIHNQTASTLSAISSINEKIEDLAKNILRSVDKENAEQVIDDIEIRNNVKLFFDKIKTRYGTNDLRIKLNVHGSAIRDSEYWYQYIGNFNNFEYEKKVIINTADGAMNMDILRLQSGPSFGVAGDFSEDSLREIHAMQNLYLQIKNVDEEKRRKLLSANITFEE